MTDLHVIRAGADPEAIIWLIIIVASIVAQVIKSAREAGPGRKSLHPNAPPPVPPTGPSSEADELRQFLESLGGAQQTTAPRPPPPPPRPTARRPAPPPVPTATVTPAAPVRPVPRRRAAAPTAPIAPAPATKRRRVNRTRNAVQRKVLMMAVRDRDTLQEAILLREVLGPPIAMRPASSQR